MNRISEVNTTSVDGCNVGYVIFGEKMEVLSSAVLNGGDTITSAFFIMQVDKNYNHGNPKRHAETIRDALGLPPDSVGMMTAAEVDRVFNIVEENYGEHTMVAVATAGLSNHVVAGDELLNWEERHMISMMRAIGLRGTINIALISDIPLTQAAKVNLMMPLVEGKTAAMNDRGYRETGTTSDSMAVISPIGSDRLDYSGTGTDIGIAGARAVRKAVGHALDARNEHPVPEPVSRLMDRFGYNCARLYEMSGCDVPIEKFIDAANCVMEDERIEVLTDCILFLKNRADSIAADGNPEILGIISKFIESVTGQVPFGNDCISMLADSIVKLTGRKING